MKVLLTATTVLVAQVLASELLYTWHKNLPKINLVFNFPHALKPEIAGFDLRERI
jgi:hypothetical protein